MFFPIAPTSNMEFQVKVEYVKDKWITFIVSLSHLASATEYHSKDLVEDVKSCCTTLHYLNEMTITLHYLDDDVAIGNVKVLMSKLCVKTYKVSRSTGKRSKCLAYVYILK